MKVGINKERKLFDDRWWVVRFGVYVFYFIYSFICFGEGDKLNFQD